MRKMTLLKVFVVLLLCVIAFGFYRGWFVLSSHGSGSGGNEVDVNLRVDPDKAKQDAEALKNKATELTGQAAEGANEPGDQTTD